MTWDLHGMMCEAMQEQGGEPSITLQAESRLISWSLRGAAHAPVGTDSVDLAFRTLLVGDENPFTLADLVVDVFFFWLETS